MLRKGLVWMLVLAFCLGMVGLAPAQDSGKPLAVVSYAGYDRAMKTLEFVGQLAGKPDLATGLEQMLKMMTGGQGLQGLDPKRPWGLVVRTEGTQIDGYAFFPVTDLKQLLAGLTPLVGPATEAGGVYKIERGAQTFFVKKQGAWAFAAGKESELVRLPDDPAKLLGDLPKDYLWAARLFVANLPAELRDMIVSRVQMIAQTAVEQVQGPDQELARSQLQQTLNRLEQAVKELDQVTVGLEIDRQARKAHLDIQVTAKAGTKTAKEMTPAGPSKTDFAGFLDPKGTVKANWSALAATPPTAADINKQIDAARKQAISQLESAGLPEEDLKTAKQILDDMLDVARQTILSGRMDGGLIALLDPKSATLVSGGRIAGGAKLDAALKRLAELATKSIPDAAGMLKMNAGTLAGMQLHTASVPLPPDVENRQQVVKLVGENLEVVVAVGDDSAYLALGRNAMAELKKVVEQSQAERGKPVQPFQLSVALVPLSKFLSGIGGPDMQQNWIRIHGQIKGLAGKDALRLTASPIQHGIQVRLEAEEGVLKAAASAAPLGGPMGGPSP